MGDELHDHDLRAALRRRADALTGPIDTDGALWAVRERARRRARGRALTTGSTPTTVDDADDHGGDDNSGTGSHGDDDNSGHGGDDDSGDDSGSGGGHGRDHPEDD